MANDTFPVQTRTEGTGKNRHLVAQLDLTALEETLAPLLTPGGTLVETDASRPAVSTPTSGPHRYTIYVPHEDGSRLSIGNANPSVGQAGITMDTKSHVHLHAYEGEHQTILSLGLPALEIGSTIATGTTGYAMHTKGAAVQLSDQQAMLISRESFVGIGASTALVVHCNEGGLLLNAEGDVTLKTNKSVNISATEPVGELTWWEKVQAVGMIAAGVAEFGAGAAAAKFGEATGEALESAGGFGGAFEAHPSEAAEKVADHVLNKSGQYINKGLGHIKKIVAIYGAGKKTRHEAHEAQGKWKKTKVWVPFAAKVVAEASSLIQDITAMIDAGTNNVKITADHNISIDADHSAKMTSSKVVVNGTMSASLIGTISAAVTSYGKANIFGAFGTSVKAMAGDLELESDYKEVKIAGKKSVNIASETEKVSITGDEDVQLNSIKGHAFLHGKEAFYVGCAAGNGFAMKGEKSELSLGRFENCEHFSSAKGKEDSALIVFKPAEVTTKVTNDSSVVVNKKHVIAKSAQVVLKSTSQPMTLKADKILLG